MAAFKTKSGQVWSVNLDAPKVRKVKDLHQIELTNLETDPLRKIRNDPMILLDVVEILCEEESKERGLTDPYQFAKAIGPETETKDAMLAAIGDAIVDFFPSGRASYVREVLAKHSEMGEMTNELTLAKMTDLLTDPATKQRLNDKATSEINATLDEMFPVSKHGT